MAGTWQDGFTNGSRTGDRAGSQRPAWGQRARLRRADRGRRGERELGAILWLALIGVLLWISAQ